MDLDTFFVSVERLFDPTLIGKPVVVGAMPGHRGVVTAASYEVRAFGVRSGMPVAKAYALAPHAVFVPGRHGAYSPYSAKVRAIVERYVPKVRAASIDEFFLDFTGCERLYRRPGDRDDDATIERTVTELRGAIADELGLPASAGIGTSHAIAKIGSGQAKPTGTLLIASGQERAFLWPLPVRKFPGIGPVAERRLHEAGFERLGQLFEELDRNGLRRFSHIAAGLRRATSPPVEVHWKDERPAFREFDPQGRTTGSISNERTFSADVGDEQKIADQLCKLVERVCWRARKRDMFASTVTLKLRYSDFDTITRGKSIPPTHHEDEVLACVVNLYRKARQRRLAIRLLGIQLSNFKPAERQLGLSFDGRPRPKIGTAIDSVRNQFGYDAIRLGGADGPTRWLA